MNRTIQWVMVLITMVIFLLNPLAMNLARAVTGDSDGSGGGQNNPLVIESSTPADGAIAVANLQYIKITFNKNIAYMTVRDSNKKCFSLWSDGQMIPIEITIADDQIEREKRNDVIIKTFQPLNVGPNYRVVIAPEFQSKSGVTLGKKEIISFTTAGESNVSATVSTEMDKPTVGIDAKPAEAITGTGTEAPDNTNTQTTTVGNTDASQATNTEPEVARQALPTIWLWVGLALVIGIAGIIYRKKGIGKQK